MRIAREVVVKEEIRYVADDGKVFLREADCKGYERDLARADLKAKLDVIECCKEAEDHAPVDGAEYYEYNSYIWYRPKTMEEADVLVKWYELEPNMTEGDIGHWICIEQSEDSCYAWHHNICHSIVYVKKLFGLLGYDVSIMKKEDRK